MNSENRKQSSRGSLGSSNVFGRVRQFAKQHSRDVDQQNCVHLPKKKINQS